MARPTPEDHGLKSVLDERGSKYGDFVVMAECICELQRVMVTFNNPRMNDAHYHALGMIMTKIGRILCGDPDYDDNWRDIAGYATCVLNNLPKRPEGADDIDADDLI